jgi:diguanylate cyclase (GGDEF)-like protein
MNAEGQFAGHMRVVTRSGESRIWAYQNTVHDEGNGRFVIGNAADVTEEVRLKNQLARANEILTDLATTDALTGLPNRRRFDDRLDVAISAARRADHRIAVIFIDLDEFKGVNDTLGHHVGDSLLQAVSQRILGMIRQSDTFARIGGDEFVLLLSKIDRPESALVVARKIEDLFREPVEIEGRTLSVGLSTGVGLFPDDGEDRESLLRSADAAMYAAKQAKK